MSSKRPLGYIRAFLFVLLWSCAFIAGFAAMSAFLGCAPVRAPSRDPIPVCLELAEDAQPAAKRAIEWWGEPVVYRCPGAVTVRAGDTRDPMACGELEGAIITWRCGSLWWVARHEFGHFLGYADSCSGAMWSAEPPGVLGGRCAEPGGTW
jgi:hypothetical protein